MTSADRTPHPPLRRSPAPGSPPIKSAAVPVESACRIDRPLVGDIRPVTLTDVLGLQRTVGNLAVAGFLAGRTPAATGPAAVAQRTESAVVQRQQQPVSAAPLSDAQRNALLTQLVSRLGSAETFYSAACQQVHERIEAERAAATELVVALITIGISYVVPGLGGAVTRLAASIPASASVATHAVALGVLSRAGAIASALGEAGKRAAPPVVRSALARSPRDLLNALVEGFAVAKDEIVADATTKIQDRTALPDTDLWVAVANWDPRERTVAGYVTQISAFYERWRTQVDIIGPRHEGRRSTLEQDRPYTTQTGVVWVRHRTGDFLALGTATDGRLRFLRFVDADLREMALARAATTQPRGVQTLPWGPPHITDLPAEPPTSAARRN